MKAVLYFPLAYVADVHGFLLLAPYLVIFLTVARSIQVYSANSASRTNRALKKSQLIPATVGVR
jgi:hypothetical protein